MNRNLKHNNCTNRHPSTVNTPNHKHNVDDKQIHANKKTKYDDDNKQIHANKKTKYDDDKIFERINYIKQRLNDDYQNVNAKNKKRDDESLRKYGYNNPEIKMSKEILNDLKMDFRI